MALTSLIRQLEVLDATATGGSGLTGKVYSDFTAKYCIDGGTLTSLTTETITTLGTYQAPSSAAHIRIKELNSADPTKGIYEVHFHNTQLATGTKMWLYMSVTGGKVQRYEVDLVDVKQVDVVKLLGTAWLTPGTAGTPDVNVKLISDDATAANNAESFFDGTGYAGTNNVIPTVSVLTGHTPQTGDSYPIVSSGTHGNAALKTLIDAKSSQSSVDAIAAQITGLNNLSALANLFGAPLLEIPDSGDPDAVYGFTLVVRDNEGKLVALDASPTIAAANAAGTDRSANLSAVSNPATGRYTFTYSVADDATPESLRITCSGTVSAEARYVEWGGAVVDYDTLTTLLAVKAKTDLIPAAPAAVGDIPTAAQVRAEMDNNSTQLAKLGTPAGVSLAADLVAIKTDTGNLVTRIPAALFAGITSFLGMIRLMLRNDAAVATDHAADLTAINANAGSGAGSYTPTTDSQQAPVSVALGPDDIQDIVDGVSQGLSFPTAADIAAELAGNNVVATFPLLIEGEETVIIQGEDYFDADDNAATVTITATGIEAAVADDWDFVFWGQGDSTGQVVVGSPSSGGANSITVKFDLPAAKTSLVTAGLGGWRVVHKPATTTRRFSEVEGLLRVKPAK